MQQTRGCKKGVNPRLALSTLGMVKGLVNDPQRREITRRFRTHVRASVVQIVALIPEISVADSHVS
jgi:hypothetical protein